MAELSYTIVKTLAVLPAEGKFHKELNLIEWGKHKAKYDLRGWNDDRSEMTKGITLTNDEMKLLIETLKTLEM